MKNIKAKVLAIGLVFLFTSMSMAATTITKLGVNPFVTPSLTSVDDFRSMLSNYETDVKIGFDRAGRTDLINSFLEQAPYADMMLVEYPKGSTFDWMFFRNRASKSVSVVNDLTWGGNAPISAYQFNVDYDGYRYNFAVPLICGNIALRRVSQTPAVVVAPPVVKPDCESNEAYNSVTNNCDCKDGYTRNNSGLCIKDCDKNEVWNSVTNNCDCEDGYTRNSLGLCKDKLSLGAAVAPVAALGGLLWLADLGYGHQFDPAYHLIGRVGAEFPLAENFSLLGLVGYAPKIGGDDGASAFVADVLGEFKFGKSFVDLGVGYWGTGGDEDNKAENSHLDLILGTGTRLFGEPDGFNTSLFLETRQGFGEMGDMHEIRSFGRYLGGLRFRF